MTATPTLVLDFDGTLCLGDDPILLFADELSRLVPADKAAGVRERLAAFLAGTERVEGAEDGYHALHYLGQPLQVDPEQARQAYHASRRRLAAGEGTVHLPEGIVDVLTQGREHGVRVVLVTNAPTTGATSWLDSVGVGALLDGVIADAGKPDRMAEHLNGLLAAAGAADAPHYLMSVGDVWGNDVEPAMALGAHGLYIDRYNSGRGPSTATAHSITDLYPTILAWAADPTMDLHPQL